jgi:RNA polymerase sigma-70 factor, ECF subfamily
MSNSTFDRSAAAYRRMGDEAASGRAPQAGGGEAVTFPLRLTMDAVRRAFARLDEGQRAILMLVCTEGLSYRQAAQVLDIPIGTVMSRLARARETLFRDVETSSWRNPPDQQPRDLRLVVSND